MSEMKSVIKKIKKTFEGSFEGKGVTAPQGMIIGNLQRYGQMKISEISEKMALSNSTVSGIIDRLEKQNITERIRSENDRRVVYVKLTEDFRKNSKCSHLEFEKKFEEILNKATDDELEKIREAFEILNRLF
ncbi:MAG: MarR family transcriptional regulator [Thermotogae bacterium]|nr:MarR family transcriptional regulator [Thermotogota bacterium]MCP5465139.1 MarR family transcriptional regulator [Thermotogota bacterium]